MTGPKSKRKRKKRNSQNRKSLGTENNNTEQTLELTDTVDLSGSHDRSLENKEDIGPSASIVTTVVFGPEPPPQLVDSRPQSLPNPQNAPVQNHTQQKYGIRAAVADLSFSLQNENEGLKAERDSLQRQLKKAQADFEKLQTEKLEGIDRFQPEFDPTIISKTSLVEQKVNSLVSFLSKHHRAETNAKEGLQIITRIWVNRFDPGIVQIDLSNKEILRKALKSLVWKFLQDELFSNPFLCYGEEAGNQLSGIYRTLYDKPHHHAESVKWRSLTVQQLEASKDRRVRKAEEVICQQLHQKFILLLNDVGFEIKYEALFPKTKPLLEVSVKLARLFAGQRAIFEFFDPPEKYWLKYVKDPYCTNIDATDDDDEQVEEAGKISFVVSPALLKRGTGMGEHLDQKIFLRKAFVHLAYDSEIYGDPD